MSGGIFLLFNIGCRKFVQVPPPITNLSGSSVYSTNATAESALAGIYISMEKNSISGGASGISALLGASADDFNLFPGSGIMLTQVYTNAQVSSNPPGIWSDLYNILYQANAVIEGASSSTVTTNAVKQQILGEAEFVRAFCNFYLVNIYGNIALATSTDPGKNATPGQSPAGVVYSQIVADLKDAQNRLGPDYLDGKGIVSSERVRPNKAVAEALLARVYLYKGAFDSAEQQANLVLENPAYSLYRDSTGMDSVFVSSSREAIWQLELPENDIFNTPDGIIFLPGLLYYGGPNTSAPFTMSDAIMASFEPNDLRREKWVDSVSTGTVTYYFPFKYKLYYTGQPPTEYPTILRLAEQFLIRAEARAKQGNFIGAAADLDIIRARANLPPTTASTQAELLTAIMRERRVELFTEYGHRWLDLKRTGMIDSVMGIATAGKGGNWTNTDQLYPIPLYDIRADPNLKQNSGYQ